jgi:hypothetical protein
MSERVFLTDARRDVLNGDFEGADSTLASHKSRIRTRAKIAIQELREVAESPEIRNEDVFEPDEMLYLFGALFAPPNNRFEKKRGLQGWEHLEEDYRAYTDRLYVQLDKILHDYHTVDGVAESERDD